MVTGLRPAKANLRCQVGTLILVMGFPLSEPTSGTWVSLPYTTPLNPSEMEPDLHRDDTLPVLALGQPGVSGRYLGLTCCLK